MWNNTRNKLSSKMLGCLQAVKVESFRNRKRRFFKVATIDSGRGK